MFSITYNKYFGNIVSYTGAEAHPKEPYTSIVLPEYVDIRGKRVDPETKQLVTMPENLIGDTRAIELALEALGSPLGCIIEIGVYKGGSAWYLLQSAKLQNRKLHLFDTFTGIPYQGPDDPTPVGNFGDVNLEEVKEYLKGAEFHIGVFPETLTDDIQDIAFIHFDGDQYQGVKDVKKYLWPRMIKGGVIFFDDSSLHGGMTGVNKAIDEEFPDYKIHDQVKMKYVEK